MPTNVTADYRKAEQAFRDAREPGERLSCLKAMLRAIPKHKGTEHLQADIKSRIKQLTEELSGPRKGAARSGPSHSVHPEGAAQVALIGPPNAGKSSLHARLTGSRTDIGPYPFTTHAAVPGMLPFEDMLFQLIDLPPISADHMEPWLITALQPADAALLVVDLSDPECLDHVPVIRERLEDKRITLQEDWAGLASACSSTADAALDQDAARDPFRICLPTLLVANKSDLDPDPNEVRVLEDLLDVRFPALATSALSGQGLEKIGPMLFEGLQIVRVYTKTPGKEPELERPFTFRRGATVFDVAKLVHKDIAKSLKFARVWGSGVFDGQQVGPGHPVEDKHVIELHMR